MDVVMIVLVVGRVLSVVLSVVVIKESAQVPDSSPSSDKAATFFIRTAALLDTPTTPVGVPVRGKMMAGLE